MKIPESIGQRTYPAGKCLSLEKSNTGLIVNKIKPAIHPLSVLMESQLRHSELLQGRLTPYMEKRIRDMNDLRRTTLQKVFVPLSLANYSININININII